MLNNNYALSTDLVWIDCYDSKDCHAQKADDIQCGSMMKDSAFILLPSKMAHSE
jgi:hypothetical protein